jgi:hypothetical protein
MTLPSYAEELKRLVDAKGYPFSISDCVVHNLDRILRDAEIAEAARVWARNENVEGLPEDRNLRWELLALIAKETP